MGRQIHEQRAVEVLTQMASRKAKTATRMRQNGREADASVARDEAEVLQVGAAALQRITAGAEIIRPSVADPDRAPLPYQGPGQAPRDQAYQEDYTDALATLIGWAHADGIEIAGWMSEGIRQASAKAGGVTKLLARRPGSWEADCIARLGFDPEIDDTAVLG
jgi:hypothetical protein